jgi:hypothetical protein
MIIWLFAMLFTSTIVLSGVMIIQGREKDRAEKGTPAYRRRRIMLYLLSCSILLFCILAMTANWYRVPEWLVFLLLLLMGASCSFCVAWSACFSRLRWLNMAFRALALLFGALFFAICLLMLIMQ